MRQSRSSLASANVDFAIGSRNPMLHNFDGCAPRQASMSRRLSRYVTCANAITRKCSVQRSVRTRTSPPYFRTCLLYTSDAADDLLCVDLGGRRIIKKKKKKTTNRP